MTGAGVDDDMDVEAGQPQLRPTAVNATLALTGLTVAVAVGMARLFAGSSFLVPVVAAGLVGHLSMWAGRRFGLPLALSGAGAMAAVALAGAWLLFPETLAVAVLPGPTTVDAARTALAEAWSQFGEVVAPAPATDGFVLAAMVGVGVTALLADWAAFRMRVLFEAIVPSFTLFAFTAILGDAERRGLMVALYLAALLLFLVVHRAGLESEGTSWFASRSRGGAGAQLQGAAVLGLVAIMAAVVVGPRLPGASADAVLAWRDSEAGGNGRRTTVSPLVDIRGRLVDQSTTEVFAVRTNQRAYWRLTSLDTFDGQIWSSDASYKPVGRRLPGTRGGQTPTRTVVQEFTIGSLSSIWLPAAYLPQTLEGVDDVSYNPELGSIITGQDTTNGLTYRVESVVPQLSREGLADEAAPPLAEPELRRFLRLPRVPPQVVREAFLQTSRGGDTAYGKALALQNYFRESFTYDIRAASGHDGRALETFLFNTKRGYCEQFAGAYAVMARAVGLPTRVAVGFTPGEMGGDGRLHVRGLNAHAWPEVYLDGFGWVAFEPTPGRGAPGAEDYTGVPEAQAAPADSNTATTAGPSTTTPEQGPATPSTTAAPAPEDVALADAEPERPRWRHPVILVLVGALVLALVVAAAVPLAKVARRRRRRAAAATAADRVWVAWSEAAEAVGRAGAHRRPSETLDEHAARAGPAAALPAPAATALATLARDAATASYAPGPLPDGTAEDAEANAATVARAVSAGANRRQRIVWTLDPRPLVERGGNGSGRRRRNLR